MSSDMKQTGGKLYDQGGYGCVFLPTLTCAPGSEQRATDEETGSGIRFIDKLMDPDNAIIEYSVAQHIRRIPLWKNYFIIPVSTCTPAPEAQQSEQQLRMCEVIDGNPIQSFRLLRMPFGGMPLSHAYLRMDRDGNTVYSFITHLLEGCALLQMFGIVHRDLHQGNILVDSAGVPRIIDFNLSVDIRKPLVEQNELLHGIGYDLFQEPPDSCIVNAVAQGKDAFSAIEKFLQLRKSLVKVQSMLGITKNQMRDELQYFVRHSKSAQAGDIVKWFQTYWNTVDTWAVGMNIVMLLTDNLRWPKFATGEYQTYKHKLLPVLRDMLQCNPAKRIDCVQALARLDADNFIVRTYGRKWLEARRRL